MEIITMKVNMFNNFNIKNINTRYFFSNSTKMNFCIVYMKWKLSDPDWAVWVCASLEFQPTDWISIW